MGSDGAPLVAGVSADVALPSEQGGMGPQPFAMPLGITEGFFCKIC